ncbi:MAG: hypothetical protein A2644_02850 [Candidatus Zambryskibacteria bacterium RIFCSPHIGHO2_01_FULL_39_63]|nr:MAG: hypothetical protein A2644_02850 [Candidatus Zambryskibacteria bacterium RIFCSPHIGHO2_01_FULL_39_63]
MVSGATLGIDDWDPRPVIPEESIKNPKAVDWKISQLFNFNPFTTFPYSVREKFFILKVALGRNANQKTSS